MGKRSKSSKQRKKVYKGPFPNNPNYKIENIRKNMKTGDISPTVNPFSHVSETDEEFISNEEFQNQKSSNRKSPTEQKEKAIRIANGFLVYGVSPSAVIGLLIFVFFRSGEIDMNSVKINNNEKDITENKSSIEKVEGSIDKCKDQLNDKIEDNTLKLKEVEVNQKFQKNNIK